MKIQIKENLYIESDGQQFIVKEYTGKSYKDKNGNEKFSYKTIGYYGNIEQLLKGLLDKELFESNATTLKELLNDAAHIKSDLENLVRGEIQ